MSSAVLEAHADTAFQIFLSHAGEDKETIARPLYNLLRYQFGLSVFFDVQSFQVGDDSRELMVNAMNSAPVGVFILSPEFVAKEWCMRELLTFVRRYENARAEGVRIPLLMPVFYRLSVRQCRDIAIFSEYAELFDQYGLFQRAADGSVPLQQICHALDTVATVWSVENHVGASNRNHPHTQLSRACFVKIVANRILSSLGILFTCPESLRYSELEGIMCDYVWPDGRIAPHLNRNRHLEPIADKYSLRIRRVHESLARICSLFLDGCVVYAIEHLDYGSLQYATSTVSELVAIRCDRGGVQFLTHDAELASLISQVLRGTPLHPLDRTPSRPHRRTPQQRFRRGS